jgi:NitT/TauT family transport system substrate-binding protein
MRKTIVFGLAAILGMVPGLAAAETVKVAVPDQGSWETSYTELGMGQGFFKEQGLDLEITHTEGGASNEKALISGSVNITVATGFLGIVSAYVQGAPVRIISPESTGAPGLFWYAKIAGPIASMADLHGQTVGFSSPGSSSELVLRQLLEQAGVDDARLVPIGAPYNGYPLVLSAQLWASWSTPPDILKELLSGEVRIIARGNDSPEVRNETVRVNAVNANFLAAHRSAVAGFLRAYKKSVDWAYSGEPALEAYAKLSDQPIELVKYAVKEFASKAANELDEIKGEDRVLAEALAAKRIAHPMTHDDIKGVYDFVLR